MIKSQILGGIMRQYPKKSAWIICLLNECEAKGDDEGRVIKSLVSSIIEQTRKKKMEIKLVLVNNASTDNTKEVLMEIQHNYPDCVVILDEPWQGKARAEIRGFNYVLKKEPSVEAIVTMDADGEHTISDMMDLCAEFEKEKPLFVVGSRFAKSGKRNKKDEILRDLLIDLTGLKDEIIPDDPRCGGRVYDPRFIERLARKTVSKNYGFQYEIVARGLLEIKQDPAKKIVSVGLAGYEPHRSRVFKKVEKTKKINPELSDLCRVISSVFGSLGGDEREGKNIIDSFGKRTEREDLFTELSDLFFKGKMVTDHGEKSVDGFMNTPPDKR